MKYATAIMQQYIRRTAMRLLVLSIAATAAYGQARTPEVPCPEIAVESGNVVAFHAYATGVQIYWWNGSKWGFVAPMAKLYANPDHRFDRRALRRPDVEEQERRTGDRQTY